MLLLHKEPAYASDIIQKLKEARLIVVEGTLYPLLTRLKNDDLLSYEWIESTQEMCIRDRVDPYVEEAGSNFLKGLIPKQILLIGSASYNPDETVTQGTAERCV